MLEGIIDFGGAILFALVFLGYGLWQHRRKAKKP
jgi:cbb3-type cytochrome oxidase subunit 3